MTSAIIGVKSSSIFAKLLPQNPNTGDRNRFVDGARASCYFSTFALRTSLKSCLENREARTLASKRKSCAARFSLKFGIPGHFQKPGTLQNSVPYRSQRAFRLVQVGRYWPVSPL